MTGTVKHRGSTEAQKKREDLMAVMCKKEDSKRKDGEVGTGVESMKGGLGWVRIGNNTSVKEDERAKEEKQHLLVKLRKQRWRGSLTVLYYTLEQVVERERGKR